MKQIIAMGGGGFSMEPDNPVLDQYILNQVATKDPKICFIPTASGDSDVYIERFYNYFDKQPCTPDHLSLFKPKTRDLKAFVFAQDILYVGGGSTKNMLALWNEWGLVDIIREALEKGVLLAGISAGAICWFEEGLTDSYGDELEPLRCLGFLSGSCCPHYDGEENRRPSYLHNIESGNMQAGYALDDGAALHFIDGEIHKVITSRPHAKAYYVQVKNKLIKESELNI
ncbi:Type 1 glutamine amidotransferase-like domain-containing protein [Halobacillus sp. BBL2006]|uniref:Type 1 glutamine amidotransferase-like domain-containing protein n=1 Tax=Halobacillus sp. BBL2006 TaxID=1543706 RepID=UPI0005444384|nr:Type 1 glutamine amidotransferase-like domain-containing protein [Halobacillus sp. BBL2006]KHE67037.1 peptidase [Halobacillus sp. BBL2006]